MYVHALSDVEVPYLVDDTCCMLERRDDFKCFDFDSGSQRYNTWEHYVHKRLPYKKRLFTRFRHR